MTFVRRCRPRRGPSCGRGIRGGCPSRRRSGGEGRSAGGVDRLGGGERGIGSERVVGVSSRDADGKVYDLGAGARRDVVAMYGGINGI